MSVAAAHDPMSLDAIRSLAGELFEHDRWSREQLLAYQRERLRGLILHAVGSSPFYRDALGAEAADRALDSLPTLPKHVLMEHFDSVVTDPRLRRHDLEAFLADAAEGALYLGEYRIFATAGTTGLPGIFVYSPAEFAHWIALSLAALARVGVTPTTRFVAIGAPSALHITRQLFAAFQSGREGVPRLSVATPLEETVAALNDYQPEAVLAYAGVLGILADEQLHGRLDIRPRVVIATSEVLTEDTVAGAEAAWGIPPVNGYAATEAPPIATGSLDHVGMHVWESSAIVEVVDEADRPVPPGEPGAKVLLTNLVNRTQPLIRYELTDSAVVADGPDPSGRPWLRLSRVDGRSDDILTLPGREGGQVRVHPHRLRAPFERVPGVRQFQVVHAVDGLLVRIVPREDTAPGLVNEVRAAVANALSDAGAHVPVNVTVVDEIEREPGPGAKLRLVRSAV